MQGQGGVVVVVGVGVRGTKINKRQINLVENRRERKLHEKSDKEINNLNSKSF